MIADRATAPPAALAASAAQLAGVGLGFRHQHAVHIFAERPEVPWFEALTDNYLHDGGPALATLLELRRRYPVALHGVSLSIGSPDPLDRDYLGKLRRLIGQVRPVHVSDHLCWSSADRHHFHDLLPLPMTKAKCRYVADRIKEVQDFMGARLLVENVSSYLRFADDEMPEWAFLATVAELGDCGILLDVNNIYVNSENHGFDPHRYLLNVPAARVAYFHLAGHQRFPTHILDSHGSAIDHPVWQLYRTALDRIGDRPSAIERDSNIPDFRTLWSEARFAQAILDRGMQVDAA
jgi:uncharacterized protein (UPF0276 family)